MYLNQFKKLYQLELIPTSHADISLGDLVWLRKNKTPLLGRKGMPNNIYNLFVAEELINHIQWRKTIDLLESQMLIPAELSSMQIKANRRFGITFHHPVIQNFFSDHTFQNHIHFSFNSIKVRVLSNPRRIEIQKYMNEIGTEKEKKVFKRYRPVHLISELYYGNLRLSIDRALAQKASHLIQAKSLDKPLLELTKKKEILYEFSNQEVPFAMRLEKLKDFNA